MRKTTLKAVENGWIAEIEGKQWVYASLDDAIVDIFHHLPETHSRHFTISITTEQILER